MKCVFTIGLQKVIGWFISSSSGYTIPAGWLVMISPMAVHLNPTLFEDPLEFNPWRWTVSDKLNRIGAKLLIIKFIATLMNTIFISILTCIKVKWQIQDKTKQSELLRNYMPFGGGIRLCLGAEFSKLFIAIFIHVLVTEYRCKFNYFSLIC